MFNKCAIDLLLFIYGAPTECVYILSSRNCPPDVRPPRTDFVSKPLLSPASLFLFFVSTEFYQFFSSFLPFFPPFLHEDRAIHIFFLFFLPLVFLIQRKKLFFFFSIGIIQFFHEIFVKSWLGPIYRTCCNPPRACSPKILGIKNWPGAQ